MINLVSCKTYEEYKFLFEKQPTNQKKFQLDYWHDNYKEKTIVELFENNDLTFYGEKREDFDSSACLYSFEEWCELNNYKTKLIQETKSMKKQMLNVLEKTYNNPILRRTTVPLFMSNPGLGKSTIVKEFAQNKGVNMLKLTLSTRMPNEVVGGLMPNAISKLWEYYDSQELNNLKDGDVLFFDEVFNGTLKQTLDAFLNFLEDRNLPSGRKLANVLIIAASNPQGLIHLTPQIKERFIRYELKFAKEEYQEYLKEKYGMPEKISNNLCILVNKEKFENETWDFVTPRSIEKAINQIGCELESPYQNILLPFLSEKIISPMDIESIGVKKDEEVEYLQLLKIIIKHKNDTENKEQKGRVATHLSN